MPRISGKVPAYCLHKGSGRAVVRIAGRDHYLGPYGSPESHEAYERKIAEWRVRDPSKTAPTAGSLSQASTTELTVNQLLLRYKAYAESYYVRNGRPTKELADMKYALRPVRQLYGRSPARDFGPLALKAVRQSMVESGLSRGVVNQRVNRIKRFYKWAVSEELVPPSAYEGLRTVAGLRYGRTGARETEPIKPVPQPWVDAVIPFVSPQVAAMIQVQLVAAMRPCEVVLMRACDIDMSGDVWIYEPHDHKNRWRGHKRLIALGPRAQVLLRPFLSLSTTAYLFCPVDAEAHRNQARRQKRRTPLTPSQSRRKPKSQPKRPKRERYDTDSYRRAITYGIKRANRDRKPDSQVPNWFPLQLRHSRATEVRKQFGIEAAQVTLGHSRADVTQVYAERNLDSALRIARETG